MALETKKSVTLTGSSIIEGIQVVYYSANISKDSGNTSMNQSITDKEVYNSNKTACRKDSNDFQNEVWALEDELAKE